MEEDSFNRYMVECESLIDTNGKCLIIVLIDTWWNVNILLIYFRTIPLFRFNRYMVECELIL